MVSAGFKGQTGRAKEHAIALVARDKMSGAFTAVKKASAGLGGGLFSLGRIVLGLVTGMLLLKSALGLAATFMVGMPTIQAGVQLRDYNRLLASQPTIVDIDGGVTREC